MCGKGRPGNLGFMPPSCAPAASPVRSYPGSYGSQTPEIDELAALRQDKRTSLTRDFLNRRTLQETSAVKSTLFAIPLLLLAVTAEARDVKSEIDAGNQKFGAAYAKGDAATISRLYTEHATVFPTGGDMATGRDGIQKVWAGAIQSGMKITSLQTVSVEQYRNGAREIGRLTAEVPNAQKQMTKIEGKYVVVWKRVKGSWMLDSDIWNLNQ
jgi:uncharacterized protein (TIGR02246 family)